MPYYLEGMDLVEGQETDNKELVEDNKELVEGNKERCIGTVNKKEKLYDLFVKSVGENPDCQKVYDDIKKFVYYEFLLIVVVWNFVIIL